MNWIEIKLRVDGESAEAVAEVLQRYGHQGVSIEQDGIEQGKWDDGDIVPLADKLTIRAYIPADKRAEDSKIRLENVLGHMSMMYPMPKPEYIAVKETDWAEAWKTHYHPIRIGKNLLIRPLWIDVELQSDDIELALDPGMAFGTGTHPTTQLCLIALEARVQPAMRILDLGCGSGILSIAAVKLGAKSLLATDIDPIAVKATKENAEQNGVSEKITAEVGSLADLLSTSQQFDLIVVNILARIIIEMCAQGLGQVVRPGGIAIFSGIIDTQIDDVEQALRETGLEPYQRRQQGDWITIEARRPEN
jgi:ribosomal protein L11 methyltransferase